MCLLGKNKNNLNHAYLSRHVLVEHKKLLGTVYHRLILSTTVINLLYSLGIFMEPWAVPEDYSYGRSGKGNFRTCSAAGWFTNLFWSSMCYETFLVTSFLMTVAWQWKDRRLACWMEPFARFFGIVVAFTVGALAAARNEMNPAYVLPGTCWFNEYPPYCYDESFTYCVNDEIVPAGCERGGNQDSYPSRQFTYIAWINVIVVMIVILYKVFKTERTLRRYAVASEQTSLVRTKETAQQGALFIAAFFVCHGPATVIGIVAYFSSAKYIFDNKTFIFSLALLTKIASPLLGISNSIFEGGFTIYSNPVRVFISFQLSLFLGPA